MNNETANSLENQTPATDEQPTSKPEADSALNQDDPPLHKDPTRYALLALPRSLKSIRIAKLHEDVQIGKGSITEITGTIINQ